MSKRFAKYCFDLLLFGLLAVWVVHFLYPAFYTVSVFEIHKEQREIIEHSSPESLQQLCLDEQTFKQCYDPAKNELNINGQHFDIATIQKNGDHIYCSVLADHEETALAQSMESKLRQGQELKNIKLSNCWWPVVLYYSEYPPQNPFTEIVTLQYSVLHNTSLLHGYISDILEPPRLA